LSVFFFLAAAAGLARLPDMHQTGQAAIMAWAEWVLAELSGLAIAVVLWRAGGKK
jgi:multisubunit Na+/H+ antiporter MnhG subunit